MILYVGIFLALATSCAPLVEVFLSPNPDFADSGAQVTSAQQQPLASSYTQQAQPVASSYTQQAQPVAVQQEASNPTADHLVAQIDEAMAEAQAHVHSAEARLQENNLLEAIREFERAQDLIAEDVDPALQYIQQLPQIQGGVSVLSEQRIQSIHIQRDEIFARINSAYDVQALFAQQQESERVNMLRSQNRTTLKPVVISSEGKRLKKEFCVPVSTDLPLAIPEEDIQSQALRLQGRESVFQQYLLRADQYLPIVASILATQGLPNDLAYMALLESGFQPAVVDPSGRTGLWQMSRSVAERYGLQISTQKDDRKDIEASTQAFASYMAYLYDRFGSWELAILAYEIDEQRLQMVINQAGSYNHQAVIQQLEGNSREGAFLAKLASVIRIAKCPQCCGFDVALPNIADRSTATQTRNPAASLLTEPPSSTLY